MPCSYCRIHNHTVDRCHHGALLRSMHIFKYHIDPTIISNIIVYGL